MSLLWIFVLSFTQFQFYSQNNIGVKLEKDPSKEYKGVMTYGSSHLMMIDESTTSGVTSQPCQDIMNELTGISEQNEDSQGENYLYFCTTDENLHFI